MNFEERATVQSQNSITYCGTTCVAAALPEGSPLSPELVLGSDMEEEKDHEM